MRDKVKRWFRKLRLWLFLLCVFFLLSVWLMRWLAPFTTAFMLQHNVAALFSDEREFVRYHWVPLEKIPAAMQLAVIASEDQKFPHHFGIDFDATWAAIAAYRSGQQAGGGSTITQQVAKNMFLWGGRSQFRKVLEWALAVLLELLWGKERILEVYLNIAQFGKQEYGVGAASQYLLQKPLAQITREEAALLASALPSPARFDVTRPSQYMRARQAFILRQMHNLGGEAYLRNVSVRPQAINSRYAAFSVVATGFLVDCGSSVLPAEGQIQLPSPDWCWQN